VQQLSVIPQDPEQAYRQPCEAIDTERPDIVVQTLARTLIAPELRELRLLHVAESATALTAFGPTPYSHTRGDVLSRSDHVVIETASALSMSGTVVGGSASCPTSESAFSSPYHGPSTAPHRLLQWRLRGADTERHQ